MNYNLQMSTYTIKENMLTKHSGVMGMTNEDFHEKGF